MWMHGSDWEKALRRAEDGFRNTDRFLLRVLLLFVSGVGFILAVFFIYVWIWPLWS